MLTCIDMRYSLLFILSLFQLFIFSPLAFADEISEGYYRIVSAGNGTGYYSGDTPPDINRNYEGKVAWYNDEGLVRWADYDANDYSMIYKLIKDAELRRQRHPELRRQCEHQQDTRGTEDTPLRR